MFSPHASANTLGLCDSAPGSRPTRFQRKTDLGTNGVRRKNRERRGYALVKMQARAHADDFDPVNNLPIEIQVVVELAGGQDVSGREDEPER